MKTIYKLILFIFLLINTVQDTYATHLAGGQITWVCKSNGKYKFKFSLYRACEGTNTQVKSGYYLCVYNHPTITNIIVSQTSFKEISQPGCKDPLTAIKCGNFNLGAMEEYIYESADIDLGNYTPGVNGWWFVFQTEARPSGIINIDNNPRNEGFTIRSVMYDYQGKKAKPCYDNSPVFTELPVGIIAKGQPFTYNPNTNDFDYDSLVVSWAKPMTNDWSNQTSVGFTAFVGPPNPNAGDPPDCHNPVAPNTGANHWKENAPNKNIPILTIFVAPYVYTNPLNADLLPAVFPDPAPKMLDSATGAFSFIVPNTASNGQYVFSIKTASYRSGILIAEVYRDYLFNVYPGQTNTIPTIPKVTFVNNAIPIVPNGYQVDVNAGDLVEFIITAQDTITQENTLTTSGLQYGTSKGCNTYNPSTLLLTTPCAAPPCSATQLTGCGTPPCAQFTFNTKNPYIPPNPIPAGGGYGAVAGEFSWQTDCNHTKNLKAAGQGGTATEAYNTFQFTFKSIDNACPVPGFRYQFIRINVYPMPILPSPELRCIKVLTDGNTELSWKKVKDKKNSFKKYIIYREGLPIDSISSITTTSYTDFIPTVSLGKNANTDTITYMVLTRMGCSGRLLSKIALDTLKTLFINAAIDPAKRSRAIISWNPMSNPKLKTSHPKYDVFRKDNVLINWTKIGEADTTFFKDSVTTCPRLIYYKIELKDSLPCTSVSNVDSLFYGDSLVVPMTIPPDIRCVNVKDDGKIQLTWAPPSQTALATNFKRFYIYRSDKPNTWFDLIDSSISNINTTTFTDAPAGGLLPPSVQANGQQKSYYYYIQTLSGCDGIFVNPEKDTLRSMYLTATNPLYTKLVTLKWNALRNPLKPTAGTYYDVYRTELGNLGGWNIVGSVPSTANTFVDTVSSCDERYLYKVSIEDLGLNCLSFSSIDTVHIVDTTFLPRVKSPSLRCASVNANGSVTLTWVASKDTLNSFYGYTVWRSLTANGPFALVDSVLNINTTTYTDAAASVNAQGQSYYYYIGTWSGCGDHLKMPPIDTLKTIKLVVSGVGSFATLNWNLLHTPVLNTANPIYDIYREYPVNSGNWSKIGTSNKNTTADTVNVCNGTLRYRVEAKDSLGCTSVSSFDIGTFQDKTNLDVMMVDSVSVTVGTNTTHIGWTPSASADVVKYIVYYFNGQINTPIDTVATPFYDDDRSVSGGFADPDKYVVSYVVASVDSCGNVSSFNSNHYSMLLKVSMDNCLNQASLTWNAYLGWPNKVDAYQIFASTNGGAYTLVGTNNGTDETFVHTGLQKGYTYSYYVRAISKSYLNPNARPAVAMQSAAASNEVATICTQPRRPKFIYLTHATVVDNKTVEVRSLTDTSRYALKYRVGRSLFENGPFKEVATVPYQATNPFISISDSKDIYTDSLSYVYNVTVYDTCGNEIITSNVGKTILLKATYEFDLASNLTWSAYTDFDKKVGHYKIYRYVDGATIGQYIGKVNGNIVSYRDNIAKIKGTTNGNFCYKVISFEADVNQYNIQDSSASNLACTQHPPSLYVPNAFVPESGNDANKGFVPRGMFISPDSYEFIVFDRWGVKQFYSNTPKQSWDGKNNGYESKQDVYVWIVKYKDQYGNVVEKNGTVTLLR
jgi:hypothetical protein